MPEQENILHRNSEEVQEIITAVPSWILRSGITIIFLLILLLVLLAAFIQYPDVVKTNLKINSLNAPKSVYAKQGGKLVSLLVKDKSMVKQNEPLAFMESTAEHHDVLTLKHALVEFNHLLEKNKTQHLNLGVLHLGELQSAFQNFYQQYLSYVSTQSSGYYIQRKRFLEQDLQSITQLKSQILKQQHIQEKEYANAEREYIAYQKLYQKGVVSISEFKQEENKYLAGKYPLQQSETALLNNQSSFAAKQKEIVDLEHTIEEEKAKFRLALNQMITQTDAWINQYIIVAPVQGLVSYAGIIQENQTVTPSQELFVLNPGNTDFFGELRIPQYNMGKVHTGQRTLVKMHSFPYEQYGLIRGKISFISDAAYRDSVFIAKIAFEQFENKDPQHKIVLKNGMQADVEIVTEESTLLQRFLRNITKMLNNN